MSETDPDRAVLESVLAHAMEVVDKTGVPYVAIGSLATTVWGPPDDIEDIDLFVRQSDAETLLKAFSEAGYMAEKSEPEWLYKARDKQVDVDLIFAAGKSLRVDDEMLDRGVLHPVAGTDVRLAAPEDLTVVLALATQEEVPHHWFTALEIVERQKLDWDYLVRRGQPFGPRVASLLLFALSRGIPVPQDAIGSLLSSNRSG